MGAITVEIDYPLAHNIVYGAVAFSEEIGINPHPDFAITQFILEEASDKIKYIDIQFGIDGKPGFIESAVHDDDDDWGDDEDGYDENSDEDDENVDEHDDGTRKQP